MKDFPCNSCGKCCRNIGNNSSSIAKVLNRGDGICQFLDLDSNLCTIYEFRPLLCRVKDAYHVFYSDKYEWDEFVALNKNICDQL